MRLEVYSLATIGNGTLAAMPCPVIGADGADPFAAMAKRGFRHLVSLLEPGEAHRLGLADEAGLARAQSLDFTAYPIPDLGIPQSLADFAQLTFTIQQQVNAGVNTLVHCRAGIGRSGLVAAGVLLQAGLGLEQSLQQISERRSARVPETRAQHDWLRNRFLPLLQQKATDTAAVER